MIQLLKEDNASPFFIKLMNRDKMNVVEVADTMKELVNVLHNTSTTIRPQMNGSSQQFIAKQLGLSKSLISQYLSIAGIQSESVKQLLATGHSSISKAYYISRIRGKTLQEIESMQISEINRVSPGNGILVHKIKTAQMILRNLAVSKAVHFDEIDPTNPFAAKITAENIEKCISIIVPNIQKVKILSEQLGYCNFLIAHNQECKCACGSQVDLQQILHQKEKIIDEILSMNDQIMSEKKYVSLLLSAKKELESAVSSNN